MTTKAKKPSAAKRVRARRDVVDPAAYTPPLPPIGLLAAGLGDVVVQTAGARVGIARALTDAPYELTMEGASTLTLNLVDQGDDLLSLLDVDENAILDEGVTCTVGGIAWRLLAITGDGGSTVALTFVDDVVFAMGQDTSKIKTSRGQSTRAQFIYRMADQARRKPRRYFRIYIPELNDLQPITRAKVDDEDGVSAPSEKADGTAGGTPGFSDSDRITVKGRPANARQRKVIDGCLAEAHRLGASDRVLVAVVMCITQESVAGEQMGQTGNDDVGIYQQGRNWVSVAGAKDPARSTRAFLLGHDADVGGKDSTVKGWKQRHGSLRNAPADLDAAIKAVQISVGGYAPWEAEAKRTVAAWNPASAGTAGYETSSARAYEFTRGTRDGRESSWTASGRLVDDLNQNSSGEPGWHRWAALNAFWYASDAELRQARPSLTLHKGAPWLIGRPTHTWNANRPVTEMTFTILARDFGLLPGAVVAVPTTYGHLAGRWLVRKVAGKLGGQQVEVTVHRPVAKAPEPPHETITTTASASSASGATGSVARLIAECQKISDAHGTYVYGGGHGPPLSKLTSGQGLDCSSSCSLALYRAGMWPQARTTAMVSGEIARSYGKGGKGDGYTIWANDGHVFIAFDDGREFNTGGHPNDRGPRLRKQSTATARFTARHW